MTSVEINEDERYVRTTFDDGLEVVARPVVDDENVARAQSLGYIQVEPTTVAVELALWQMCRDHDILHTLLAEAEGRRWSLSLRYAASGARPSSSMVWTEMDREERAVLLVQRILNVGIDELLTERSNSEAEVPK